MKYSYATLDEIPEPLRTEYTEVEGTFVLNVTDLPEGFEVSNVTGLKSALKKERDNNKSLTTRLAELEGQDASATRTLVQQNAKLLSALNEQKLENCSMAAITEARGNPALLRPVLEKRIKIDDGKPVVIDDAGQPLLAKDGTAVSVRDFVLALREMPAYQGAFAGSGQSGSGTPPSGGNGGTATATPRRSQMSVSDKAAYIKAHGTDKFMQLAP